MSKEETASRMVHALFSYLSNRFFGAPERVNSYKNGEVLGWIVSYVLQTVESLFVNSNNNNSMVNEKWK